MLTHHELISEIRERSLAEKLQLLQELARLIRHEAKDVKEEEDLMMRIAMGENPTYNQQASPAKKAS